MSGREPALAPDEKICPFCAETIKKAAVKCRYCQSELPVDEAAVAAPPTPEPVPEHTVDPVPEHTADPVPERGVVTTDEPAPPAEGEVRLERREQRAWLGSGRLTIGLLVLCLLLAGGAFASWWWGQHQDDEEVNGAISSAQARDAGIQQAATLTQKVLSYDWSTLDKDIASAEAVLAPSFRSEYAKTMSGVRAQTVKNHVVLKATVVASSTVSATPDKVVALVFVNQVTTAAGTKNQRLDQNRVLVTLMRHGGEWRVSKMDAF